MTFQNINTHKNMVHDGQEKMYHIRYDSEVGILQGELASGPRNFPFIIDGQRLEARSHFDDPSPIDGKIVVGRFPIGTVTDIDKAVDAAQRAFRSWSRTELSSRLKIFERAADMMDEARFQLAAALTYDNGKDRHEAVAEADEAIDFVRYYVQAMRDHNGFEEEMLRAYEDERTKGVMRPYGVWAVVCPFNFPLAISCGMMTGAIITGNTVVMKPASPAPLLVYLLYDIFEKAGVPPGVINVVTGSGAEMGDALTMHPGISGVVFTGSKEVGYRLLHAPKRYPTPVIAEMGGKNAAIICASADLERAVKGVARSAFSYSGQKCSACSRVYVHESIFNGFIDSLVQAMVNMPVGDPRSGTTYAGPVVHAKAVMDYERYVEMARRDGKVVFGGKRVAVPGLEGGHYVAPTIVTGLQDDHHLVRSELFLPILCVQHFHSLEEAVRRANEVEFGLTSGIYSREQNELQYYFDNIEAGVTYANRARGATTGAMVGCQPFGGWKASGTTGKGSGTAMYLTQFLRQQSRTVSM